MTQNRLQAFPSVSTPLLKRRMVRTNIETERFKDILNKHVVNNLKINFNKIAKELGDKKYNIKYSYHKEIEAIINRENLIPRIIKAVKKEFKDDHQNEEEKWRKVRLKFQYLSTKMIKKIYGNNIKLYANLLPHSSDDELTADETNHLSTSEEENQSLMELSKRDKKEWSIFGISDVIENDKYHGL